MDVEDEKTQISILENSEDMKYIKFFRENFKRKYGKRLLEVYLAIRKINSEHREVNNHVDKICLTIGKNTIIVYSYLKALEKAKIVTGYTETGFELADLGR